MYIRTNKFVRKYYCRLRCPYAAYAAHVQNPKIKYVSESRLLQQHGTGGTAKIPACRIAAKTGDENIIYKIAKPDADALPGLYAQREKRVRTFVFCVFAACHSFFGKLKNRSAFKVDRF